MYKINILYVISYRSKNSSISLREDPKPRGAEDDDDIWA